MFIDENFEVAVRPGTPTTGVDAAPNSAPIKTANPFTDVEPNDEAVAVAEPVEATAPCEAPELDPEEDEAYTPNHPTSSTPNTKNEEETEDSEPEIIFNLLPRSDGEPAHELNSASDADENVADAAEDDVESEVNGSNSEPTCAAGEQQEPVTQAEANGAADVSASEPEEAIAQNSANADDSLALSDEEKLKTAKAIELVKTDRKCRYELGKICAEMHKALAKRGTGTWQHWCYLVHLPVKTADSYRKVHAALLRVPEDLLTAVINQGVDPSKPKATKALLRIVDTFYTDGVTKKLVNDLAYVVKQAVKREPNTSTVVASVTAPAPVVPITTVHPTGGSGANGGSTVDSDPVNSTSVTTPAAEPQPTPETTKPEKVETVTLRFHESNRKQLEVLEKNLRSFLGTTCMEETVMESFRRLSQMNAVARADAPADEEVLPCE